MSCNHGSNFNLLGGLGTKTFNSRRDDSIKSGKAQSGAPGCWLEPPSRSLPAMLMITYPSLPEAHYASSDEIKRVIAPHHRDVLFKGNVGAILSVWP